LVSNNALKILLRISILVTTDNSWKSIRSLYERVCAGEADPCAQENASLLAQGVEFGAITGEELDQAMRNYPLALIEYAGRKMSSDVLTPSEAHAAERCKKMLSAILGLIGAGRVHPEEEPACGAIRAGLRKQLITFQEWEAASWGYYQNEHVQRHLLNLVADGSENPEKPAVKLSINEGIGKRYYTKKEAKAAVEAYHRLEAQELLASVGDGMLYPDSDVLKKLEGYVGKDLIAREDILLALEGFHAEKNRIGDVIRQINTGRTDPDRPDVRARMTAALAAGVISPETVKKAAESYLRAVLAANLKEAASLGFVVRQQKRGTSKSRLLN